MTAREFLEFAGWEGDLEKGLALLSQYVGKGTQYFLSFPDAKVVNEDGIPLSELPDEPAGFQEYADARIEAEAEAMKPLLFLGTSEVAEILGWDRRKVSVYYGRGKLPKPVALLKSGPVWAKEDIEQFKKEVEKNEK